ncbi:MAG: MG2 domain-containing protein [Treponema sp.]
MKYFHTIIMLILSCLLLSTCGKDEKKVQKPLQYILPENLTAFQLFFTPVFAETTAEPEQDRLLPIPPRAITASLQKDSSIIPGVRPFTKYKTRYNPERTAAVSAAAAPAVSAGEQTPQGGTGVLTVADWGPQQRIPSAILNPSLYVVFSVPVKALTALDTPAAESAYLQISPAVPGVFRWYGSRYLAFEADAPLDPFQEYTITVPETVTALNGSPITGQRTFTVTSDPLKITDFRPGYTLVSNADYWIPIDTNDLIPEASDEVLLRFNYPVSAEVFAPLISAHITIDTEDTPLVRSCSVTQKDADSLLVKIIGTIPHNASVVIRLDHPKTAKPLSVSYHTLRPFSVKNVEAYESYGTFRRPIQFYFSHPVDEKTVAGRIRINGDFQIKKENIHINGSRVTIHGLPLAAASKYRVQVIEGIKDIYGRILHSAAEATVTIPPEPSSVDFLDRGITILEAVQPHKFLFEYQNIEEPSAYSMVSADYPLYIPRRASVAEEGRKTLNTHIRDQKQFEIIDLDPFLKNGKGAVRFDAVVTLNSSWDNHTYTMDNCTTIQVTDLAITARCALNKTVALVSGMSTGKPIEGADVYLYDAELPVSSAAEQAFAYGKTDSQGLAVLMHDETKTEAFFKDHKPALLAEKDGDRVVFVPDTHRPWQSGIDYIQQPARALEEHSRVFLFSDRGLYKPGETCFFRGVDRTQKGASFEPYSGSYTVTLENTSGDSVIVGQCNGATSDFGGFWGEITLPKDTKPGYYLLKYGRNTKEAAQSILINVAYFERLKFQAGIVFPAVQAASGDSLYAELEASYLSGGGLTNAAYKGSWFRQGFYFQPDDLQLKDYRFGPHDIDTGVEYLTPFKGTLSGTGKGGISCKIAADGEVGAPYYYIAEALVTDKSNQQITTRSSYPVHPGAFYIGIGKAVNVSGFAKTEQKLTFPFILAGTNGKPLDSLALAGSSLSVSLIREDWHVVQQRGSAGSIYSSYEQENILEYSTEIKTALKGSISVTPQKAGHHILVISGKDTNGKEIKTEYPFYVTGSNAVFWNREFETALRLTPDQALYNPGDTAQVLLESPLPAGTYIITVEREGIFTEEIREFTGNTSVLDIPIAANYVPVVYVSVASYSVRSEPSHHKYGETDVNKPKGYYGVTELHVNSRVKAFSIALTLDKETYKPGDTARVTLTASRGGEPLKNAELTLLAVDRGVLDIINYHVPNPIEFFYNTAHFPLCVNGGDTRAYLLDPVIYEVKNLMGGDSDRGKGDDDSVRDDFNPVAVFKPVLITDEKGQVSAEFVLPDTLTSYRITAVGVYDDLNAIHEEEITVKNTVNVLPAMPRRLRERDTSECGVLLSNLDTKQQRITVKASVRPASAAEKGSHQKSVSGNGIMPITGEAFIDGAASHTVTVGSGQQAAVYFDIAAVRAGAVEVVFSIDSPALKETLVQRLEIEKPLIFETFTAIGSVAADESAASEAVGIPSFAESNKGSLTVSLDAGSLAVLAPAVSYLLNYPYNCMEQQSSRMMPLVLFGQALELLDPEYKSINIPALVQQTFASWAAVQNTDGGFPYWEGDAYSSFYVSLRIAHLCAAAKKSGYTDADIGIALDKLLAYIQKEQAALHKSKSGNKYIQAYSCYVQALHGKSFPEEVLDSATAGSVQNHAAAALAGLAYLQRGRTGDKEKAGELASAIRRYLRPTARGVDLTAEITYPYWYANNSTLDFALILQLFAQLKSDDEMATKLLHTLLERQKSGYWCSTAITAHVCESVKALMSARKISGTDFTAAVVLNGTELVQERFSGEHSKPARVKLPFEDPPLKTAARDTILPLRITKNGTGTLYYQLSLAYALPQEMQQMRDEGLGIMYTITDAETGKSVMPNSASAAVIELKSGKLYNVDVRLSSGRDYTFVALRVPVPSGAEIINPEFASSVQLSAGSDEDEEFSDYPFAWRGLSSRQIYDNEVQYFWNDWMKGGASLHFSFRAVRRGVFPCPPPLAECMYENEIFGRGNGYLFVIK